MNEYSEERGARAGKRKNRERTIERSTRRYIERRRKRRCHRSGVPCRGHYPDTPPISPRTPESRSNRRPSSRVILSNPEGESVWGSLQTGNLFLMSPLIPVLAASNVVLCASKWPYIRIYIVTKQQASSWEISQACRAIFP